MGFPAGLEPRHGLQDEVIEAFRPGPVQGNVRWRKDPAQATAMPVAPPDPGRALRAAPVAAVHSPERNAAGPARTRPARWPHRPYRCSVRALAAPHPPRTRAAAGSARPFETRAVNSAPVVALAGPDGYGQPLWAMRAYLARDGRVRWP